MKRRQLITGGLWGALGLSGIKPTAAAPALAPGEVDRSMFPVKDSVLIAGIACRPVDPSQLKRLQMLMDPQFSSTTAIKSIGLDWRKEARVWEEEQKAIVQEAQYAAAEQAKLQATLAPGCKYTHLVAFGPGA